MPHFGLLARLLLFLMAALLAVIVATLAIERSAHPPTSRNLSAYPRIIHAAGIVMLVRGAGAARQQNILDASNNDLVYVSILDHAPATAAADIAAPQLTRRLRAVLGATADKIEGFTDTRMARPHGATSIEGSLTKVIAPIDNSRTLLIEWRDPPKVPQLTLLGLAPGIWAGVLGFGVAALALLAMVREVQPLRHLTESVRSFDGERPGLPLTDKGAPDIRRLARALRGMQERVAGLLRERSFVIGAISHDLRTYLTRLRLRTESLPDGDVRELMEGDLDKMAQLIDTSLAFARGTTSSQTRTALDLSDLVATEVEEHAALGLPLKLQATYAGDAIVQGDALALRRVICNILDNAQKFARDVVTVTVARSTSEASVVIADDGPGVPAEERAAIFDPFHRVERSRSRDTGGTGLGLAIARQIVEAHGGTIEVEAAATSGAAFTIRLPCVAPGKRS